MGEIERMDAFSLVVRNMEKGNKVAAQKLLEIIIRSIQQENRARRKSSLIRIENAEDAKLFGDLVVRIAE